MERRSRRTREQRVAAGDAESRVSRGGADAAIAVGGGNGDERRLRRFPAPQVSPGYLLTTVAADAH